MTKEEAKTLLQQLGYDIVEVFVVIGPRVVFTDTAGNVRIKDTRRRFEGLKGVFYDNHSGQGETAIEAAIAAIHEQENHQ